MNDTMTLPASPETERALLGAILLSNGKLYPDVRAALSPEEFYLDSHRRIFREMGELHGPIDLVTLTEALLRSNQLDAVGGASYLSGLTDGTPALGNVEAYNEIIKRKADLRRLAHIGNAMMSRAAEDDGTAEELAAETQRELLELSAGSRGGLRTTGSVFQSHFSSIDTIHEAWRAQKGTPTGLDDLDTRTGGLHAGELALLAARPSLGKTALALNIAVDVADSTSQPVAIFSLEMTERAVMLRLLCAEAAVDSRRLEAGFCSNDERKWIAQQAVKLIGLKIHIDDQADIRPETMLARAKSLQQRSGSLSLVVVDYLQLVSGGSRFTRGGDSARYQEISYVSRSMKAMAKELSCPVLALSQLNRAPEDRTGPPRLSDLRESGQLEQDADAVLFLWHEQPSSKGKKHPDKLDHDEPEHPAASLSGPKLVNCTIAKQRNGPTGTFPLDFYPTFTRFRNHRPGQLIEAPPC